MILVIVKILALSLQKISIKMRRELLIGGLSLIMCGFSCKNDKTMVLQSGINKENLDTTISPSEDFYQYACGGWMKNHPLTPEYSRYGTFDKLGEDNQLQIKNLVIELASKKHKKGSEKQKIGDLYNLGMDSIKRNQQAAEPIADILNDIVTITNFGEFQQQLTNLHTYGITPLFGVFGEANPENSDMTIAWLWQSGIKMGDRDYYLLDDSKELREHYKTMMAKLFTLCGYDQISGQSAETMANAVMDFETALAKVSMDRNTCRDPQMTFNYRSIADLQAMLPQFDFQTYFNTLNLNIDSVNVGQVDYISSLSTILSNTSIQDLKSYLAWQVICGAASYLSDNIIEAHFEFYGKQVSGKEENQPRWKRVINTINNTLGEAVGKMYVQKYFPQQAKERMIHLVDNLKLALADRINTNTWMSKETKNKAIEKLNTFTVKIGYPDKWRDYSKLTINDDSFYANLMRANKFEIAYQWSKINKPVDKTEWLMNPQTVNAYYNPTTNEICFPAAILQPPFFDMTADDAVNYGAIGVVIGHEMTHGFDDKGSQYDKDGNLKNWWTEADAEAFKNRTQVLADYFNQIEVLPGLFADGNFTLGENIADNGGIQISFLAMTKAINNGEIANEIDGFSAQERFFLAYANVWAGNIRDEEIKKRTKEDPHSLGRWRVNGTLPHIDAFANTYQLKEGDKMYLNPEKRALIW